MTRIILASSSPYRQALLSKLELSFSCQNPAIDESAKPGEAPRQLVERLSHEKALAIGQHNSEANKQKGSLIIGSDQVAVLSTAEKHTQILTKPLDHDRAVVQLEACNNQLVTFYTGLCLYNSLSQRVQLDCIPFRVKFKKLSNTEIENYLRREQPYNCAGSFKAEGLGITLFERFEGEDPNSLIGLPLIRLTQMLINEGVNPLVPSSLSKSAK